jgi:hypothetical protein
VKSSIGNDAYVWVLVSRGAPASGLASKFWKIGLEIIFEAIPLYTHLPFTPPLLSRLPIDFFESDTMGKDKVEKEKKRAEKKEKRAEKDGVHKAKKEKQDKKDKTALADAVEKEITSQVLEGLDQAASAGVAVKGEIEVDAMAVDRPVGAIVPFAIPLVEDKQAKKVLKSVKKGKSALFFLIFGHFDCAPFILAWGVWTLSVRGILKMLRKLQEYINFKCIRC